MTLNKLPSFVPARRVALALLALALLRSALLAQVPEALDRGQIEANLRLERKLLSLDLAGYGESRARLDAARRRASEVLRRLDDALAGETLTLGALEGLYDQLTTAAEAERTAGQRVDRQIERVAERMRQIAFLEGEGRGQAGGRPSVSGRWRMRILPTGEAGSFELRQDGTVVTGNYTLDGGGAGSFRGTLVGSTLKLERIDSAGGDDSAFTGTLDAASGRINGTWQAHELAGGQPSNGTWSAARSEGEGERQP